MNPRQLRPDRIVSLLAAGTEILFAIGLGERVVGISHECDYPAEVENLPRLTSARIDATALSRQIDSQVRRASQERQSLYEIDGRRLAGLAPELIVTQAQCDVCAVSLDEVLALVRSLDALERTHVVALNPMSLDGVLDDIRRVGEAAGCDDSADRLITELNTRVEAIRKQTEGIPPGRCPRVACIEWIDPPIVAGNWIPELVELAGGTQSLAVSGSHSPLTSWQSIVEFDPQVIVVMPCGFDLPRTLLELDTLRDFDHWEKLAAVRTGRVYAVDGNAYFNRSGPRIVDSLEILAHLLHPDCVKRPVLPAGAPAWQKVG